MKIFKNQIDFCKILHERGVLMGYFIYVITSTCSCWWCSGLMAGTGATIAMGLSLTVIIKPSSFTSGSLGCEPFKASMIFCFERFSFIFSYLRTDGRWGAGTFYVPFVWGHSHWNRPTDSLSSGYSPWWHTLQTLLKLSLTFLADSLCEMRQWGSV